MCLIQVCAFFHAQFLSFNAIFVFFSISVYVIILNTAQILFLFSADTKIFQSEQSEFMRFNKPESFERKFTYFLPSFAENTQKNVCEALQLTKSGSTFCPAGTGSVSTYCFVIICEYTVLGRCLWTCLIVVCRF